MTQAMECVLTRSERTAPGLLAQPFWFQGSPMETFGYETAADWTDFDTLGRRRASRPVSMQLTTYEFDTMFADYLFTDVPSALQGYIARIADPNARYIDGISTHPFFEPAQARVNELRRIQKSLTPMILTMADPAVVKAAAASRKPINASWLGLSAEVTIRSVRQEERHGEPDTRYVHISFVEYTPAEVTRAKRGGAKGVGSADKAKLKIATLHSNQQTVARLAKLYYGDPSKVQPIYNRNKPWLSEFGRNDNLRVIATGLAANTSRNRHLRDVLQKHPQIIIPALPSTAAGQTRVASTTTYQGG